jgi:hypothetical protein
MSRKKTTTEFFKEVYLDLSSEDYHGLRGTYSSSQLKDAIADMEVFYKKYISKEIGREEIDAFSTGTYFHTLVLEPHLIDKECAVFKGVRRGAKWEAFKAENEGKAIITEKQKAQAERMAKVTKESPIATELIDKSTPEVSAFLTLLVDFENNEVYTYDKEMRLTTHGWEFLDFEVPEISETARYLTFKVRADALGIEDGYILDLKSTTGNAKDEYSIRKKVSNYSYDLSAAMYLDIFSAVYGKDFDTFYWTFASKDYDNCKNYRASLKNILVGRAKWKKAVIEIAKAEANEWVFEDEMAVLEPEMYQLEWIKGEI